MSQGLVFGKTYEASGKSVLAALDEYFLQGKKFEADAAKDQATLYDDAQNILDQLNGTINTVAAGFPDVTIVQPANFKGHDVCAATPSGYSRPSSRYRSP